MVNQLLRRGTSNALDSLLALLYFGSQCPLMTQSGHCSPALSATVFKDKADPSELRRIL